MERRDFFVKNTLEDRSVDYYGRPAIRAKSGGWVAGIIILCKLHVTTKYSYITKIQNRQVLLIKL